VGWNSQQVSRQGIGSFADEGAGESVVASASFGVTRPDDKIIVLQKLLDDGEVFWVMGKVCVHSDELIVFMVDRIFHRHQMRRSQAQLGRPMDHMNSRICRGESI